MSSRAAGGPFNALRVSFRRRGDLLPTRDCLQDAVRLLPGRGFSCIVFVGLSVIKRVIILCTPLLLETNLLMSDGHLVRLSDKQLMKPIPKTKNTPVLRTDFSDETSWELLSTAILQPESFEDFQPNVDFICDPDYDGLTVEQMLLLIPPDSRHRLVYVVDRLALMHPEHPILVVDVSTEPGRSFRVIPSETWAVENNLSLGNMSFAEFADAVDQDGIFRDFPEG